MKSIAAPSQQPLTTIPEPAPARSPTSTDAESPAPGPADARRLGEDPDRPGVEATPRRVANALRWLTGAGRNLECLGGALFEERHDSMVLVREIELYSLVRAPHAAVLRAGCTSPNPHGRIMGLSKTRAVVDVSARRLQVQERITDQIADALTRVLGPGAWRWSSRRATCA